MRNVAAFSCCTKIEKSHLIRSGHIARMSDERLVKQTTMGWIRRLVTGRKPRKRKMTMLMYWYKLLKEANIETYEVERMALDIAKWKSVVKDRMRHIEQFEKQQGHQYGRLEDEGPLKNGFCRRALLKKFKNIGIYRKKMTV